MDLCTKLEKITNRTFVINWKNYNRTFVLKGKREKEEEEEERRKVVSRSHQDFGDLIYCIMGPGSLRAHLVDSSHKFIFKMSSDSRGYSNTNRLSAYSFLHSTYF